MPLWDAVRARLERTAAPPRSRLRVPPLSPRGRYLLHGLMGSAVGATIDLAALEARLVELGVGSDLTSALAALGHPVSPAPSERRAARRSGQAARASAREAAVRWPEPWAATWIASVIRAGVLAGLDPAAAVELVADVRRVLDRIASSADRADRLSRVDLAATVLGSAHDLDWGTRAEAAVTRALVRLAAEGGATVEGRAAWHHAGVDLDVVSAPVLTWRLPLAASSPLGGLVSGATALGVPLHLTQLALRRHPVEVPAGVDVLVVENPRVVEAAAQADSPLGVVALNGNPTSTPLLLLDQLLAGGARLRYHGDLDAAGIRICLRMHALGLHPWRMGAADYLAGLAVADREGIRLPVDPHRSPPTPWDPPLQAAFDASRRILHEERDLEALLTPP